MKIFTALLAALGLAAGASGYENVSVKEFSKIIKQNDVQILDVRTPEEYAEGHIEDALLANYNGPTFKADALKVLKKGKKVAIYCRSGRKSAAAAEILAKEGFELYNLETGIIGWTKAAHLQKSVGDLIGQAAGNLSCITIGHRKYRNHSF